MSSANLQRRGHSAEVRMELRLNGDILPIAQLGRNFLILTSPINHPPAEAEIRVSIDGHERRWWVRLIEGVSTSRLRTKIAGGRRTTGPAVS
jgi:hypothetical protein